MDFESSFTNLFLVMSPIVLVATINLHSELHNYYQLENFYSGEMNKALLNAFP